jgi:hypothetical protein
LCLSLDIAVNQNNIYHQFNDFNRVAVDYQGCGTDQEDLHFDKDTIQSAKENYEILCRSATHLKIYNLKVSY